LSKNNNKNWKKTKGS